MNILLFDFEWKSTFMYTDIVPTAWASYCLLVKMDVDFLQIVLIKYEGCPPKSLTLFIKYLYDVTSNLVKI